MQLPIFAKHSSARAFIPRVKHDTNIPHFILLKNKNKKKQTHISIILV